MTAMEHVRYLAKTIGPRGSTTAAEAAAARYAEEALRAAGLSPVTEGFTSARSAWHPYALFTGLVLVGEALLWLGGRGGAAAGLVLGALALGSVLLELLFRPNPLRWLLPKGASQNVWARIGARDEEREQVVLVAHLDTHRTPLAFSTDRWLAFYKRLVPLGLACVVALIVLCALALAAPGPLWRPLSLPFAAVVGGLFLITLQADLTPYTEGANDNASGVGVVLSLAARLREQPLAQTTVWAVLTGCEEVGDYGAEAFARAHRAELGQAAWIAVDNVGGAGPAYFTHETFFLTAKSDPGLLALADKVAGRRPDLGAYPSAMQGAYTEGSVGAMHGMRVLTFVGHRRDGVLPDWHRPSDTLDRVDPAAVERTEAFLWELVREMDGA